MSTKNSKSYSILPVVSQPKIDCNSLSLPKTVNPGTVSTPQGALSLPKTFIESQQTEQSSNTLLPKTVNTATKSQEPSKKLVNKSVLTKQKLGDALATAGITCRVVGADNTIIVETDKDVYINNYENITEQKYINNICGGLQVGEITGSSFSSLVNNATKLGFDTDSGFEVTDLGSGLAKIGMNSTFKCWEVDGAPGLVASGLDTVNFVAGSGVTITSCNTAVPKTLTISASGGGGTPGGSNRQIQFNDGGSFGGNGGLTYCSTTCALGVNKITVPQNTNLEINVSNSTAFWYSRYGDLNLDISDDYASQVQYDTQGNIYIIGADGNNGSPYLVKYDQAGNIVWQKQFTDVSNYYKTGDAVATDSSDNVYCIVGTDDSVNLFSIFKFDSSGNLIWSKDINSADYHVGMDIIVDGSSNIFVSGFINPGGPDLALLMKFNSSGSLLWQKTLATGNGYASGVTVDSSGNSYIVSSCSPEDENERIVVVKYDSSGNVVWQKPFAAGAMFEQVGEGQITVDNSGNVYLTGRANGLGDNYIYVLKLDSSGTIVWQTNIDGTSSNDQSYGIVLDLLGNIYISGYSNNSNVSGGYDLFTAKLDSSGTVLWQRLFGGSANDYQYYYWAPKTIDVYDQSYVVTGYSYSPNLFNSEAITVQLPTDGSLTGTYGAFTYKVSTFTTNTTQFTAATSSFTSADSSLTVDPSTLSVGSASNTNTLNKIYGGSNTFTVSSSGVLNLSQYSLPFADGPANTAILTDGSGSLYWGSPAPKLNSSGSLAVRTTCSTVTGTDNLVLGNCSFIGGNGTNNIVLGTNSLNGNYTGCDNIAIGSSSQASNGSNCAVCRNISIGANSLSGAYYPGCNNIAVGYCSQAFSNCNCYNITIGNHSLAGENGAFSRNNIIIGEDAARKSNGVNGSIAIGERAMCCYQFANGVIAIGRDTLGYGSCGLFNMAIGTCAGFCLKGPHNLVIGAKSMTYGFNTSGCNNVVIGHCAVSVMPVGTVLENVIVGHGAYGGGYGNVAVGTRAGLNHTSAEHNVSIGFETGGLNTGQRNVAVGAMALGSAISGCNNVAVGYKAGCLLYGGCNNLILGYCASSSSSSSCNQITLGNSSITCLRSQVTTISSLSDQRDKTNVEDLPLGLQFILDLRPVKFTWNMRDGGKVGVQDSGFIAQEVAALEDQSGVTQWLDMVGRENPDKLEVKPGKLIPILVKAMQDMHTKFAGEIDNLKAEIATLKGSN